MESTRTNPTHTRMPICGPFEMMQDLEESLEGMGEAEFIRVIAYVLERHGSDDVMRCLSDAYLLQITRDDDDPLKPNPVETQRLRSARVLIDETLERLRCVIGLDHD